MRLVGKIKCNDSFEAYSALNEQKIPRSNKKNINKISEFYYAVNSDEFLKTVLLVITFFYKKKSK